MYVCLVVCFLSEYGCCVGSGLVLQVCLCFFAVRVRELGCVEVHVCLVVLVVCYSFSYRIFIYSTLDFPKMDFQNWIKVLS